MILRIIGDPRILFSDNGWKFISDEFYEIRKKFSIKVTTVPTYSLCSKDLWQSHNQFLAIMLDRTLGNAKCDYGTALVWAVWAKKRFKFHNGFRPTQYLKKILIFPGQLMTTCLLKKLQFNQRL